MRKLAAKAPFPDFKGNAAGSRIMWRRRS